MVPFRLRSILAEEDGGFVSVDMLSGIAAIDFYDINNFLTLLFSGPGK